MVLSESILSVIRSAQSSAEALAAALGAGMAATAESIAEVQRTFASLRGEIAQEIKAQRVVSLREGTAILESAHATVEAGLSSCLPGTILKLRSRVDESGDALTVGTLTGKGIKTPLGIRGGTVIELPKGEGADAWLARHVARPYRTNK